MSLTVQKLECGYHGKQIVAPISFELSRGDGLALLGPNGSGKTTLLKSLVGSLRALSGSVSLGDVKHYSKDWSRCVAFVPQDEAVAFPFTVREMVMMGRMPWSPGFADTVEDVHATEAALARADCLELADRPITEMSGGEKQRTLIARALAQIGSDSSRDRLLLLDEPATHLDFAHQTMLVSLINELRREGVIVIASWHDLHLPAHTCNLVALMVKGQLERFGATDEVLNPTTLSSAFGAEFLVSSTPVLKF
jgi:iron complex transport system ATP-binding protein